MRRFLLVLCTLAATTAASASAAGDAYGNQYWSPGWCKSVLQQTGVDVGDGRSFNVSKAFCIGRGGRECEWDAEYPSRDYRSFLVIARSYDGNVRGWTLLVTGRNTWSGRNLRLLGHIPDPYRFAVFGQGMANDLARVGHEKGCMPYRG